MKFIPFNYLLALYEIFYFLFVMYTQKFILLLPKSWVIISLRYTSLVIKPCEVKIKLLFDDAFKLIILFSLSRVHLNQLLL